MVFFSFKFITCHVFTSGIKVDDIKFINGSLKTDTKKDFSLNNNF